MSCPVGDNVHNQHERLIVRGFGVGTLVATLNVYENTSQITLGGNGAIAGRGGGIGFADGGGMAERHTVFR